MAKVKGLVVEIAGDTSELQKALKDASKQSQTLTSELKAINSSLKLDTKSPDLLAQKEQVLNESIKETKNLLQQLKEEQKRFIDGGGDLNTPQYRLLQRQISDTEAQLKNLEASQDKFIQAGEKINKVSDSFKNLSNNLNNIGNKLTIGVTAPIVGIATAGIQTNATIEKMTTSLSTFLGSSEEASKVVEKLRDTASKTTFDTTSFIKANQMLISTGENAEDASEMINALGDAIIATGGGNDELVRMSSNLQQIKNAGKATSMDIRQFAYAGIDVYGILADSLGKTTQEIKDMDISYQDLESAFKKASSKGGKYFGAMEKSSGTLTGQINQLKASTQNMLAELTKSLMPVAKDVIANVTGLVKKFSALSDAEKKQIVNIGLILASIGPIAKILGGITGTISSVTKGIGIFSTAIGTLKTGVETANTTANTLAKGMGVLTNPTTGALVLVAGAILAIKTAIEQVEEYQNRHKEKLSEMATSASEYVTGIDNATSHLDAFNEELFASNEEQQQLQENMDEVQKGITQICKTASDERRGYTEEEITQLDEYFRKLRELKNKEVEIQQQIAKAISQQAETNAQTFQGSLDEYKVKSQEWIKTAQEQKDRTLALLDSQTIEEIALLNQRYGSEANMQNEAYATEYNSIIANKDAKIKEAEDEVQKVREAYANGYTERLKASTEFFDKVKENNQLIEKENEEHKKQIDSINDSFREGTYQHNFNTELENGRHNKEMQKIWGNLYDNMSEDQAKQLGVWMALLSQTELYGGDIDDETKSVVNGIINSFDSMPKETKEAMKDALSPMLDEMEKSEPSLFAKARGIADGILNNLRKAFDIHSPSKETKKIFQYVMEGAEEGLASEENALNKEIDNITKTINAKFGEIAGVNMGDIQGKVIDAQKTIFTTPEITFNVQKMNEENLNQCFNYINRRFGSAY